MNGCCCVRLARSSYKESSAQDFPGDGVLKLGQVNWSGRKGVLNMSEGTAFLVHRNHISSLRPSCVRSSCLSLTLSASVTANSFCVSNVQTPSKVYT